MNDKAMAELAQYALENGLVDWLADVLREQSHQKFEDAQFDDVSTLSHARAYLSAANELPTLTKSKITIVTR